MNYYEEKQEQRRERLRDRAAAADAEASSRFKSADAATAGIPLGQPILVGHHSEKRHRAALARQDTNMRKGIEASDKAKRLRGRAHSVGLGGISSDDPEAVDKLHVKLNRFKKLQAHMKAINASWRKAGKPDPQNDEAGPLLEAKRARWVALLGVEINNAEAARGLVTNAWDGIAARSWGKPQPVESFTLSNLSAKIRATEKRIALLLVEDARAAAPDRTWPCRDGNTITATENETENRVQLIFDRKPGIKLVSEKLRQAGFVWSPTCGAWQRKLNNAGRHAVTYAIGMLQEAGYVALC